MYETIRDFCKSIAHRVIPVVISCGITFCIGWRSSTLYRSSTRFNLTEEGYTGETGSYADRARRSEDIIRAIRDDCDTVDRIKQENNAKISEIEELVDSDLYNIYCLNSLLVSLLQLYEDCSTLVEYQD